MSSRIGLLGLRMVGALKNRPARFEFDLPDGAR
jgi:hypothetical protein